MNVKELRLLLETFDDDALIVLSSDAEGNKHSPLANLCDWSYRANNTWSGDIGFATVEEAKDSGYDEEDVIAGGVPAVVLSPIN